MLTIEKLNEIVHDNSKVIITGHAAIRLRNRGIRYDDIINTIRTGEIIEDYPDDYPLPSCLVFGTSVKGKIMHVVCGSDNEYLWIISAYYPSEDKWLDDFKTRR